MRWFITIIAFNIIVASCVTNSEFKEVSVPELLRLTETSGQPLSVLVGDYKAIKRCREDRYFRDNISHLTDSLFCMDISLRENRSLVYIFQLESSPAILYFGSSGQVDSIVYLLKPDVDRRIVFSDEVKKYKKDLLYLSLGKKGEVKNSYQEDFLYNYYMALSYEGNEDSSKVYSNKAFRTFYGDEFLSPLYADLIRRFLPEGEMSTRDEIIVLPTMGYNESVEVAFEIMNMGDVPLVFHTVDVSCSCVSVAYPQYILGHSSDSIMVKYHSGNVPGPVEQSITLVLNTKKPIHRIKVKGLIKEKK